jgi:hypothetical protein
MKTCFEITTLAFPISLKQQGVDRFTVVYGQQVRKNLSYDKAALKLGAAIMHALACNGELDNREAGEAR